MMKLSDDFAEWFKVGTETISSNRGHFVKITKKPNARNKVDFETLMTAFGGHKNLKQEWEYTYIPTAHLTQAIRYGFHPLYRDNVAFLPTHIENKMLFFMTIKTDSHILMPQYGYGLQSNRDWSVTRLNSYISKDDIVDGKYSGIFFRGILREGVDWKPLEMYHDFLVRGGTCVAMLCSNTLNQKDFNKFIDKNFSFKRYIDVPQHEMSLGRNRCDSSLIILKK